ncbi:MAG: hypothetical protein HY290_12235 [Planctomycetia bacterium]|nr:hypothetical protein [Planctomycetia bacterium]
MVGMIWGVLNRIVVAVAVLAAVSTATALAQSKQALIDVSNSSMTPPIRSDAPITFVWRIVSQSSAVVEGELAVTVHDGPTRLAHVSDGIVISAGEQFVRTVLPPIESHNVLNALEVHVEFHSQGKKIGAWDLPVQAPGQWQRRQVILVCDPWQGSLPPGASELIEQLRIEKWNAVPDATITTIPARIRPEELPADSLLYCGFDVVFLAHEGFAELKESQLRPLFDWVEAGGSLFLAPGNVILKDYHAVFLNQAAHAHADSPLFVLDGSGRLITRDAEAEGGAPVVLKRHGLGRVAIVNGKLDQLLKGHEADVRGTLAWLWKMRRDRLDEFRDSGKFLIKSDIPEDQKDPNENQWGGRNFNVTYAGLRPKDMQLATLPLQSGDQLVTRLMPEGLKVVPLPLIGLILVSYVLLIGPADWMVLGAIRRRKWTWFTFPAVTIALTLLTVWLAEWYMHIADNRRAVTFHDLGTGGKIARRNRFEVLFQGSERRVTTDLNREFFSDMSLRRFSNAMWMTNQQSQLQGVDQRRHDADVPTYLGRVPSRYKVSQFLSQWTPQLNRRFSIARSDDNPPQFDWNKFANALVYRPETIGAGAPREALLADVKQVFGEGAHVAIFVGGKRTTLMGNFGFLQGGQVYGADTYNQYPQQAYYPGYNPNQKRTEFLDDVSVNGLGGLFAVVSQSSPTGGKDFEDMAVVDPSDPDQWLLVVAVERGGEVDLYRKLYAKGD